MHLPAPHQAAVMVAAEVVEEVVAADTLLLDHPLVLQEEVAEAVDQVAESSEDLHKFQLPLQGIP
jgi:hypothetical protein